MSDYEASLEKRIEEHDEQMARLSYIIHHPTYCGMLDGDTGETGSQVELVDIATATEKHKKWVVAHHNRCVIYSISALTSDDLIIRAMMRQAGYENFDYKVV